MYRQFIRLKSRFLMLRSRGRMLLRRGVRSGLTCGTAMSGY